MLEQVLQVLREQVEAHIRRIPSLSPGSQPIVHLSHVATGGAGVAIPAESLGLSLINIEQERVSGALPATVTTSVGNVRYMNPEVHLVLYLLFVSNFAHYPSALKFLSPVISFFQSKKSFTKENTPGLEEGADQLVVELHTLALEEQNHLWGTLGTSVMPSVMYRVRLVRVQEGLVEREAPALTGLGINGRGL